MYCTRKTLQREHRLHSYLLNFNDKTTPTPLSATLRHCLPWPCSSASEYMWSACFTMRQNQDFAQLTCRLGLGFSSSSSSSPSDSALTFFFCNQIYQSQRRCRCSIRFLTGGALLRLGLTSSSSSSPDSVFAFFFCTCTFRYTVPFKREKGSQEVHVCVWVWRPLQLCFRHQRMIQSNSSFGALLIIFTLSLNFLASTSLFLLRSLLLHLFKLPGNRLDERAQAHLGLRIAFSVVLRLLRRLACAVRNYRFAKVSPRLPKEDSRNRNHTGYSLSSSSTCPCSRTLRTLAWF